MKKQSEKTKKDPFIQAVYAASLDVGRQWARIESLPDPPKKSKKCPGWRAERLASEVLGAPEKQEKGFYGDIVLQDGRVGEVKGIGGAKSSMLFDKAVISERLTYRFKRKLEGVLGLKRFEDFFIRSNYTITPEKLRVELDDPALMAQMIREFLQDVHDDMGRFNIDMIIVMKDHGFLAHVPHDRFLNYITLGDIWTNKLHLALIRDPELYAPGCLQPPKEWLQQAYNPSSVNLGAIGGHDWVGRGVVRRRPPAPVRPTYRSDEVRQGSLVREGLAPEGPVEDLP